MSETLKGQVLWSDFLALSCIGPAFVISNCSFRHASTSASRSLNIAAATVLGAAGRIEWISIVFPDAELGGGSTVAEFRTANAERAILRASRGIWSTFRLSITIMLTTVSAEGFRVSTKIAQTTASAVGTRRVFIAGSDGQVSRYERRVRSRIQGESSGI